MTSQSLESRVSHVEGVLEMIGLQFTTWITVVLAILPLYLKH